MGRLTDSRVEDIRIALGSIAAVPLRLRQTEQAVVGRSIDSALLLLARKTAMAEVRPIDDIRSTARYRATVAGNLVVEFLSLLASHRNTVEHRQSNDVLGRWNLLPADDAAAAILPCCGSKGWARGMVARRPLADEDALLAASNETWRSLAPSDWMEAFHSHPRIGQSRAPEPPSPQSPSTQSVAWSAQEQRDVADADDAVKMALAAANREYERRFNRIFIVCATGKSAPEILDILQQRLNNDTETELHEAADQQRQITEIRLKKWLRR
jgi:2-oxo-4-hydroxy-4-carboxy-5-ureidoimidazoline decarboxylase